MDCFGTYFTYVHLNLWCIPRVQSATEWTASVHTLHMPRLWSNMCSQSAIWTASVHTSHVKPVMFLVLRNGLLRFILHTLSCNSCSKCYGMDCFGTYCTHDQTCDVTRVQSATEWTASVHILHTCQTCDVTLVQSATEWTASVHTSHMSNLWCNSCSKCYGMDCFGTYCTHDQTCGVTHVHTCDDVVFQKLLAPTTIRNEVRDGSRSFEVRGSRSEVRGSRSEVPGSRSEVRGPRFEVRGSRFEVRGSRSKVRGSRFEVRGPRFEVRGPRFEVRGLRSEVRGSRFEVRGLMSEVRGPKFEVRGSRSEVRGSRFDVRGPRSVLANHLNTKNASKVRLAKWTRKWRCVRENKVWAWKQDIYGRENQNMYVKMCANRREKTMNVPEQTWKSWKRRNGHENGGVYVKAPCGRENQFSCTWALRTHFLCTDGPPGSPEDQSRLKRKV